MLHPAHRSWWQRIFAPVLVPTAVPIQQMETHRRCPECHAAYEPARHRYCQQCYTATPEWRYG
jgi:uncharacterized paraquat-inducible protein A